MKELQSIVKETLGYIRSQQNVSGAIYGGVSPNKSCQPNTPQPTLFCSALILEALRDVQGSQSIKDGLAQFLIDQKSKRWSWNYWTRDSDESLNHTYPDDFDDTAYALVALYHHAHNLVPGEAMAHFVQNLIAHESKPGGPYYSWLVEADAPAVWRDIDVAVNANIGFCLSAFDVSIDGLNNYLSESLKAGTKSAYYHGDIPVIYFLSKWYRGEEIAALRFKIQEYSECCSTLSALHLALLLKSACDLSMSPDLTHKLSSALMQKRKGNHWPAATLYGEPSVAGKPRYAGSAALTSAFALEALIAYAVQHSKTVAIVASQPTHLARLPESDLRANYESIYKDLVAHDTDGQISLIASTTAAACSARISDTVLQSLNQASINGWIAYTIYDNVWDDEPNPLLLGVANYALRTSVELFRQALTDNDSFQHLVSRTLTIVDAANSWEIKNARAAKTDGVVMVKTLPNYQHYQLLAARSWGHILAASGVLSASGYTTQSPEQKAIEDFFEHYLIARQLNDDAHDWEEDLQQGHMSSVVCLLVQPDTVISISEDIDGLRLRFWDKTIITVVELIHAHCEQALLALERTPLTDTSAYAGWVQAVAGAADLALAEKRRTEDFIRTYSGNLLD